MLSKMVFSFLLILSFYTFAEVTRVGDNTALVVIDMQPSFVERGGNQTEPENVRKTTEVIANQIQMIQLAKQTGTPIVFVEYENFGDTHSLLRKAAEGYENIKFITKNSDGMFNPYNNKRDELGEYLRSKEIGNLIITGANGGACVEQSISDALENNYNVLAYGQGIADFNYKDFIFPYTYNGKFDNPNCVNCSFREYNQFEALSLHLNTRKPAVSGKNVNTTERIIPRETFRSDKAPIPNKERAKNGASAH